MSITTVAERLSSSLVWPTYRDWQERPFAFSGVELEDGIGVICC